MTEEEHKLLVENNIMLKQLLSCSLANSSSDAKLQDFLMNVVANVISNNTDNSNK